MKGIAAARNLPKDLLPNLDSIAYQASRLVNLRDSQRTESLTERSAGLLTAAVKYYSVCLTIVDTGLLSK